MKSLSLIALGGLCISASAMAAQPSATVTVNAPDPFAAGAIQRGDLARAGGLLTSRHLDDNDPIRLLNLGAVCGWRLAQRAVAPAPVLAAVNMTQTAGAAGSTDELTRERSPPGRAASGDNRQPLALKFINASMP